MEQTHESYKGWAVVELMGHRKLTGYIQQVEQFGAAMLRVDIFLPGQEEPSATQFYGGQAIYCITPTTEAIARGYAQGRLPQPVSRWELPAAREEEDADIDDAEYEPDDVECEDDDGVDFEERRAPF